MNVLDHEARRTILMLLRGGEMTAGAVATALGRPRPGVSYHLSALLDEGLISCRMAGTCRIYKLDAERLVAVLDASLEAAARAAALEASA